MACCALSRLAAYVWTRIDCLFFAYSIFVYYFLCKELLFPCSEHLCACVFVCLFIAVPLVNYCVFNSVKSFGYLESC